MCEADEFQHWVESSDSGHSIVKNPATGNWEYAMAAPDGTLVPCNMKVAPGAMNAPGLYCPDSGLSSTRGLVRFRHSYPFFR